jgi:protein-disulfide isomerase/plastocyanin
MEQKQLDEMEDSFFGDEFIEEEDLVEEQGESKKEIKKKAAKKTAAKKASKEDVKMKEETKTEDNYEEIKVTPVKDEKNEKVEKVETTPVKDEKNEEVQTTPSVDPWGDDEPGEGMFTKITTWKVLTGLAIILLILSVFTHGFNLGDNITGGATLSLSEAEEKAITYVNSNLLQPPFVAELKESAEVGNLYKITLSVSGQDVESYMTKDGSLFFPQGFEMVGNMAEGNAIGETATVEVSMDDDAVKGDENAPVTIIEFSEFQCPFCGKFFEETYPQIVKNYVDTGKVKYVFRDFPLDFHPNAQKAAEAAECAGEQDKYFEMHDLLFANQDALDVASLKSYAKKLKLNTADFDECLDSGAMADEVAKDLADGQSYGITGTPGFFINGKMLSGAMPYEAFEAEIEAALADDSEVIVVTEEELTVSGELAMEETEATVEEPIVEETTPSVETTQLSVSAKKWLFSPNVLKASAGDTVELTVVPQGLSFTFTIPSLGVEEEVSGTTKVTFTADKAGSYDFTCSSCEDWRGMTGTLVVE